MTVFRGSECPNCGARPRDDDDAGMKIYECVQGHWACERCVKDYNNDPNKVFNKRCPCCGSGTLSKAKIFSDD